MVPSLLSTITEFFQITKEMHQVKIGLDLPWKHPAVSGGTGLAMEAAVSGSAGLAMEVAVSGGTGLAMEAAVSGGTGLTMEAAVPRGTELAMEAAVSGGTELAQGVGLTSPRTTRDTEPVHVHRR